jgi:hypothetical protein
MKNMTVKRVSKTEFETADGGIHELPLELDEVPTVEEFQKNLDMWRNFFQGPDVDNGETAVATRSGR